MGNETTVNSLSIEVNELRAEVAEAAKWKHAMGLLYQACGYPPTTNDPYLMAVKIGMELGRCSG